MKKTKVNESIRIAKEGIGECWDDMAGATGQTPEGQGEGPMTVTINMPGKNISVTTDSADEIANILKLAGIQIGGMSADTEMPAEMPGELAGVEEPAVMYVGAEPTVAADQVPGDNDGDGDHDMTDHDIEQDGGDSEEEESEEEDEPEETDEAVGDKSYTSKGGTVTQTPTGLTHQAGSGVYGGTETDAEEAARKEKEQELAKKDLPEASDPQLDRYHELVAQGMDPDQAEEEAYQNELDESARILQLAGVTNEAQSAAQKAAFKAMIAKKNGGKADDKSDSKDDNKKPDADNDGVPDWADKDKAVKEEAPATNSIFGQGVYEQSYARILELAGLHESASGYSPEMQAQIKNATEQQLSQMAHELAGNSPAQYNNEYKMLKQAQAELAEGVYEGEAASHDYIDYVNKDGQEPPQGLIDQNGVEYDPESGIISVKNATSLANTHRSLEAAGWQKHALAARRNPTGAGQARQAGDSAYQLESARILALAGVSEGKLMNSPAGTSMDEPKLFDNLPSARGEAGGRKDYGANRANGQGENPMGDGTHTVTVEEQFKTAMGEYRKFVAETISRKK